MAKLVLVALLAASLTIVGCTAQPGANTNTNTNTNQPAGDGDSANQPDADNGETETDTDVAVGWKRFENRAANYSVTHPSNWYWRHYISTEISNREILDYFVTDSTPLPGLRTEYLGQIVIEVSTMDANVLIAELKQGLTNPTERTASVAGQSATRLEGTASGEVLSGFHTIAYILSKGEWTYRIWFNKLNASTEDIARFEELVTSFSFNN